MNRYSAGPKASVRQVDAIRQLLGQPDPLHVLLRSVGVYPHNNDSNASIPGLSGHAPEPKLGLRRSHQHSISGLTGGNNYHCQFVLQTHS